MMKSKLFEIISIFVFIVNHIECYSYDWPRLKSALNCTDLNPQRIFSVPDVLGTWYGYETFANQNNEGDEVFVNPCVVIQLSDISYGAATERTPQVDTKFEEYHNRQVFQYDLPQQQPFGSQYFHYLKLRWSEQYKNVDYILRFNTSRPGLWYSASPQKGTMQKLNYGQFDGSIQALRVTDKNMLLTFCIDQFFTIILTREPKILSLEDLQTLRILMNHHGLSIESGRQDCSGSISMHTVSFVSFFVTIFVTLSIHRVHFSFI